MRANVRRIEGNWTDGYVLDKHTLKSVCVGYNDFGHPVFDTTRSEIGEALFLLKYRQDQTQIGPIAEELARRIVPNFRGIHMLVPMPASNWRPVQPVTAITTEVGRITGIPVCYDLLTKTTNGKQLKDLTDKADKTSALADSFSVHDVLHLGNWNAILIDDLYHTGASVEAACSALRKNRNVGNIFVAAVTWR
ncbi:hypothetical protein BLA14095_05529 [Burkholderia lata]|uniref:ComF family protein n=1 Tax=Burkholderia lata (strain ATCC 17760 / DSM 23089 / LMG 22485 / NCIMB 9086 / R18194 / 383) TaxID=482957 RepID=UPI0014540B6C|nr:ComF family protein [Burkholderia lata]VWC16791.1 hypothetical protein BLA14095_05529 [Burkholderia lata]